MSGVHVLQAMAAFQGGVVALFVALLLLTTWRTWRRGDHTKAVLGLVKGQLLICAYVLSLTGYGIHVSRKELESKTKI